jgi:hypothetical protein
MHRSAIRALLGVYAGLLVAPAVTLLPGSTWPLFAVGVVLGGAVGVVLAGRVDTVAWLASRWRVAAGGVAPLVWFVPMVTTASSVTDLYLSPWFPGACAAGVWGAAATVALNCRHVARMDQLTDRVTFSARPPATQRRQLGLAAAVLLAISGLAAAAMVWLDADVDLFPAFLWVPSTVPLVVMLLKRDGREVGVTDEGLRVQVSLYEWSTFSGYELTDDALVLSRAGWYRSQLSFDPEDIEDVEAVVEALDRYLPARLEQ